MFLWAQRFFVSLVLLAIPTTAFADCDAILEQGVRNTYQELSSSDLKSGFSQGLCSSSESSTSKGGSAGGGLTVPIYGVPVGINGSYNKSRANSMKSSMCQNGAANLSDSDYHTLLTLTADPLIVDAWSKCRQQGGLYIEGKLNGSLLTIKLRFQPMGSLSSTTLVDDLQVIGANCAAIPKAGTVISNVSRTYACHRHGQDAVTVIANDKDSASATFFIPAVSVVQAAALPSQEQCLGNPPFVPAGQCTCKVPASTLPPEMRRTPPGFSGPVGDAICIANGTRPGEECSCPGFGPSAPPLKGITVAR